MSKQALDLLALLALVEGLRGDSTMRCLCSQHGLGMGCKSAFTRTRPARRRCFSFRLAAGFLTDSDCVAWVLGFPDIRLELKIIQSLRSVPEAPPLNALTPWHEMKIHEHLEKPQQSGWFT